MTNEELARIEDHSDVPNERALAAWIRRLQALVRNQGVDIQRMKGENEALSERLRVFEEGLVGVESDATLLRGLLALVTPHCSGCSRPATKFEGTNYGNEKPTDAKRYACDEHATAEIKWTDLPGAETIREAIRRST